MHHILKNYFCKLNNEGRRTVKQGHNLKLMGLRAGASDLFIYYPTMTYNGLWLEVKRNKIYTKSEMQTDTWILQQEFLSRVKSVGYAGETCYGFEDGLRIIENYMLS